MAQRAYVRDAALLPPAPTSTDVDVSLTYTADDRHHEGAILQGGDGSTSGLLLSSNPSIRRRPAN